MEPAFDPLKFAERAREDRLEISTGHASEVVGLEAVKAAYSIIRDIDTTGFEPAAIFVPTVSGRDSE